MTNVTVCDTVRAGMLGCYFIFGKLSQLAWSLLGPQAPAGALPVRGRGRHGVSMPFPLGLEVHYVQSACSVSNKNETGFYNQLKGNFM